MAISDNNRRILLDFYFAIIGVSDFERHIYNSHNMESDIGSAEYSKLIAHDYASATGVRAAKRQVRELYEKDSGISIVVVGVMGVIDGVISGKVTVMDGCRILSDIYLNRLYNVGPNFTGYVDDESRFGPDVYDYYRDSIMRDICNIRKVLLDTVIKKECYDKRLLPGGNLSNVFV